MPEFVRVRVSGMALVPVYGVVQIPKALWDARDTDAEYDHWGKSVDDHLADAMEERHFDVQACEEIDISDAVEVDEHDQPLTDTP